MSISRIDALDDCSHALFAPAAELRAALNELPILVHCVIPGGALDFASRRLLDYLGVDLTALQDWPSFVHEEDRRVVVERWNQALASGEAFAADYRLRRADGMYRWFRGRASPVMAADRSVRGWQHVHRDMDLEKRAEHLLRSNEERRRVIIDNIPGMVAIHSATGEVELQNRAAHDFHRRTLEDTQAWKSGRVVHPDDLDRLVATQQRGLETGEPTELEIRIMRGDGMFRWVLMRSWRSTEEDGVVRWYTMGTDIHEWRTAEDKLRRNEAFLLEVQRLSGTFGWRLDPATGKVEVPAETVRAYASGSSDSAATKGFWANMVHPDDRPHVRAKFETCLRERIPFRSGHRFVAADGSTRYVNMVGNPVLNEAGQMIELIGASMDMTEHWRAMNELEHASEAVRDLQTRMSRAAQVASVGELAASIAHEVNQPLAAVVANAHACVRWLTASPPNLPRAIEGVERMVKDGQDAIEVIRGIRALFRPTALEHERLDANQVVKEVLRLFDSCPGRRDVTIDTALATDLPPLLADRVQLQQLLLNLMVNAIDALRSVGDRARQLLVRTRRDTDAVIIQVVDNGVGIQDAHKVFAAFFTTKADGMGLGLAICRSIASAHGGRLSAERNTGFGTTFTVSLPVRPGSSS